MEADNQKQDSNQDGRVTEDEEHLSDLEEADNLAEDHTYDVINSTFDDLRIRGLRTRESLREDRVGAAVARVVVGEAILVRSRVHALRVENQAMLARKRFVARRLTDGTGLILTCIGAKRLEGYSVTEGVPVCEACLHLRHEQCEDGVRYSMKRSPVECRCGCGKVRRPWVDLRGADPVPVMRRVLPVVVPVVVPVVDIAPGPSPELLPEISPEQILNKPIIDAAEKIGQRSGLLAGCATVQEVMEHLCIPRDRQIAMQQDVGRRLRSGGWRIWQPRIKGKQVRVWRKPK